MFRILGFLALGLGTIHSSHAAFTGPYATNRWTLVNTNADGFVNYSNAPQAITLTGGNNQTYLPGYTEWRVAVTNTALLQFDWRYFTLEDDSGPFDRAGWRLNSTTNELARNDSTNLAGSVSTVVSQGDTFAFWVRTGDNLIAPGVLIVTNFTFSPPSLRFTTIGTSNDTVLLQLQTIPGRTYRVEASAVLPSSNWLTIRTNFISTNELTTVSTSTSNFSHRFFRAVLLP